MKSRIVAVLVTLLAATAALAQVKNYPEARVSFDDFKGLVAEVEPHRASRLVDLDTFLKMSKEPGVIVLDTRSTFRFERIHVKGARHLSFTDFTQDNLQKTIPSFDTTILIYCNNNFDGNQTDFASKIAMPRAGSGNAVAKQFAAQAKPIMMALNVPTYINLYGYGYRNVYELHELVNVSDPRIAFEGSMVEQQPPPVVLPTAANAQTVADMEALGKAAAQGSHAAIDELETTANQLYRNINYQGEPARTSSNLVLMTAAFVPLAEEAGKGSYAALEALKYANGKEQLRSFTVNAFGIAAGLGNADALAMLLHYKENGFLLSSTVFALQRAAEKNIPEAVEFLVQVIDDPEAKPLWAAASQGLVGAATMGNEKAKAALLRYSEAETWQPALQSLRGTTNSEGFARSEIREVQNAEVSRLFGKAALRIFRANHWYKPGHPAAQGAQMTQAQYVLRPKDDRIYRFGDTDDMIALAREEHLVLSNEPDIKAFAAMACYASEVAAMGEGKWELTRFGSGRPVKWVRILTLDETGLPSSITAAEETELR